MIKIGDTVKVTVDRPMGSRHPEHSGLVYEVNYGYIEGTKAEDGEEIDAYVLGVYEPIDKFCGRVIAIIRRLNDIEDKLVVAPFRKRFRKSDIIELTEFQEKYFKVEIEM